MMLRKEWQRIVDWNLAMGLPVDAATAAADHAAERENLVRAARDRRFNEYGMPRRDGEKLGHIEVRR